jgi:YD repeat-containing protein
MKSLLLLLFTFLGACRIAVGQNNSVNNYKRQIVPPAPNAASLGKYGDIPVSLASGIPSVSIPLYEIQEGDLSLPISLNYHASGVKVAETASWVGLGWSLNAGGMITRSVQGGPDEGPQPPLKFPTYLANNQSFFTGYYRDGYILPPKLTFNSINSSGIFTDALEAETYQKYNFAAVGSVDCEPDIFFYNFGGYSGKFFFKVVRNPATGLVSSREAVFLPRADVKVEVTATFNYGGGRNAFEQFVITTPDGVKYYFGENGATEASRSGTDEIPLLDSHTASWMLTRMVSPTGRQITFEYVDEEFNFFNLASERYVMPQCEAAPWCNLVNKRVQATMTRSKRLAKIRTSQTEVNFVSGSLRKDLAKYDTRNGIFDLPADQVPPNQLNGKEPRWLDKVEIKTSGGSLIKAYKLGYDYFSSPNNETFFPYIYLGTAPQAHMKSDRWRLKLKDIQELGEAPADNKPPYRFTYVETSAFGSPLYLPRRISFQQDKWGYYNGATTNRTLVQAIDNPVCSANRNTNPDFVKVGSLQRIQYPTGGITTFEMEPHRLGTDMQIGGLRIARLISSSGYGPDLVKEYEYGTPSLFDNPIYMFNVRSTLVTAIGYSNGNGFMASAPSFNSTLFAQVYSSSDAFPMQSLQGSHVGYTYVKEKQPNNGYTAYTYDNLPQRPPLNLIGQFVGDFNNIPAYNPNTDGYAINYPLFPPVYQFTRGNLLKQETFDQNNVLLNSKENQYETIDYQLPEFPATKVERLLVPECSPSGNGQPPRDLLGYTRYPVYTGISRIKKTVERTYALNGSGNYTETITDYAYESNKHLQPTKTTTTNSLGEQEVTKMVYPLDYGTIPAGAMGALAGIKRLQDLNIVAPVIEQYAEKRDAQGNNPKVVGGTLTEYWPDRPLPKAVHALELREPLANFGASNRTPGSYQPDTRYARKFNFAHYDGQGNIVQQQAEEGVPTTYLWGHSGTLPVAEAVNALRDQIFYEGFEETTAGTATDKPKAGRKYRTGGYTFTPAAGFVPAPGSRVAYFWRTSATDPWKYKELAYVGGPFVALGEGTTPAQHVDEFRVFPSGAMLTTYTYDPLVGLTSATDPNGVTTYYEYDGLGRLKLIRDQDGNIIKALQYNYKQ